MDYINKSAETVITVCLAVITVQIANKLGAFDGVKKWWKKTTGEDNCCHL